MENLWGPAKDLDYWTARARGLVGPEESRAMALLASLCNERRFSFYCRAGMLPAMGNATKRLYLVRRFATVVETDWGVPVASWCVVTRDREIAPETDHIVTLKNLIEGEEIAFRGIGNRSNFQRPWDKARLCGFQNVYTSPFLEDEPRPTFNDGWDDYDDTRRMREASKAGFRMRKDAAMAAARRRREMHPEAIRFKFADATISAGYNLITNSSSTTQLFFQQLASEL